MDIVTYSRSLEERLKSIIAPSQDDLISLGKTLSEIRLVIVDLKGFASAYKFTDSEEEIMFFREIKPVFLSQYYFHKRKFKILLYDSFNDEKNRVDHYRKVLSRLERFLMTNQAFYQYCLSGSRNFDQQYFTRRQHNSPSIEKDEQFSTPNDSKLAKLLSAEMIRDFIQRRRLSLVLNPQNDKKMLEWTSSKVALIEMIYALHAAGVFNYGKVELKRIVETFEATFAIDLGNYARVFSELKIRKSGQANFLEHLRTRLLSVTDQ